MIKHVGRLDFVFRLHFRLWHNLNFALDCGWLSEVFYTLQSAKPYVFNGGAKTNQQPGLCTSLNVTARQV